MKKRTVSVVLSFCLFASSVQAGFWDSFKAGWNQSAISQLSDFAKDGEAGANFGNITTPQPVEGGGYYGGSVEFRVDTQTTQFEPWFDAQEPSASMSCSGITLKGGFIKALGLEDIAEQLGDASGAVVYGLFIALVNSMPSIEHVFSGIKRIIQDIQNKLANACDFGRSLGESLLGGGRIGQNSVNEKIGAFNSMLDTNYDKLKTGVRDFFKGKNNSAVGGEPEQAAAETSNQFTNLFNIYGFTKLLAPNWFKESDLAKNGYTEIKPKKVEGKDNAEVIYLFAINLFGDFDALTKQEIDFLERNGGSQLTKLMAKGKLDDKGQEAKLLDFISGAKAGQMKGEKTKKNIDAYLDPERRATLAPATPDPERLVATLLNGTKYHTKKLKLRTVNVYYGMAKTSEGLLQFMASGSKTVGDVEIEWKGLLQSSEEIVNCYRNAAKNKQQATGCKSGSMNLVVPNATEMLNTINSFEAMSQSNQFSALERNEYKNQADDLAYILARLNALYCAQYFLHYIQAQIMSGTTGTEGYMSKQSAAHIVSQLMVYIEGLEKSIFGRTETLKNIKDIFKEANEFLKEGRNKLNERKK